MKTNSNNISNKSNSKKIQQSLNLKFAKKIKIQFSTVVPNFLDNSLLFKIYLKSYLIGKTLNSNKENYEINLFNKNFTFVITNVEVEPEIDIKTDVCKDINNESFIINEETQIEIGSDGLMNGLTKDFENKLNLNSNATANTNLSSNEENIIKNILENRDQYLFKLDEEEEKATVLIGFEEEMKKLDKIIKYSLKDEYKSILNSVSVNIPDHYLYKAVLIAGPNGIGKSNMIKYINKKYKNEINFFNLDLLNDFILNKTKDSDNSSIDDKIKTTFKFAKLLSPSIVIFEDIDRLFTKDEEESSSTTSNILQLNDTKTKLIFSLIREIDNLTSKDKVILLSTSTNIDRLSGDLRKCGRFDSLITLTSPNQIQRKEYFKHLTKLFKNNLSEEDLELLADKSPGFVAGDIIGVFKDALMNNDNCITRKDLEISLRNIKPINLKDIILDIPKTLWSDIGGNKEVITKIRQSIEWPLKNPEAFKRIGITPPNGILLYGPPGCSKTMIAKALATESGLNFFAVKGPELFSKFVGDSEKAVRDIFKKAKISSPSIIFFDEIDSMASQRGSDSVVGDKVLCQLLNEMDGVEGRERVVIFGATNRPDILDKAMIRPGRFDRLIYIPPPDIEAKREIFRINLQKMSVDKDLNLEELLQYTNGFSGAEINLACREAGMIALNEDINALHVSQGHIIQAIKQIKPVITREMIKYFEDFAKNVEL